jgi:hypothetical protein
MCRYCYDLHTYFYTLSFNGLLINAIKLDVTENFTMAAMFLFPLKKKSNKSCISSKIYYNSSCMTKY